MRILVADDHSDFRHLLAAQLHQWGHDVLALADGLAAWEALEKDDAPPLAVLDWMMPGLDGVELTRRVRARFSARPLYIILLTALSRPDHVVQALEAGADDYVTKPFDTAELRARVGVGLRVARLQTELAGRVAELEDALAHVQELHGILPICSYCKKVQSDPHSWQRIEEYVSAHSAAKFSHGVCPECLKTIVEPQMAEMRRNRKS